LGTAESTPRAITPSAQAESYPRQFFSDAAAWTRSAHFLAAWIFPAALAFYLKWYLLAGQNGFARVARSQGLSSLNFYQRIGFFRGEIIVGVVAVPIALFLANRFLRPRWAAPLTLALCLGVTLVLGLQILSLKELGRFSSLKMIGVALRWGWHEPGSNAKYLLSVQALAILLALLGTACAVAWAVCAAKVPGTDVSLAGFKNAAELLLFVAVAALLLSVRSDLPATAYHQSAFTRAFASLRGESGIETGEAASLDMRRAASLVTPDLSGLSAAELIERYRTLANVSAPEIDPRYFGKESGANILFLVLETTPQKYLPVGADLRQFPNFNRLQDRAFVGTRHYTTFPITHSAVFSLFSSWYPIDDPAHAFDSPSWDATGDFLRRLETEGYKTAAFSPLRSPGIPDGALFDAVGFRQQIYPQAALTSFDESGSWQEARVAADEETLHLLESQLNQWMARGDRFAAAFLPQIAHSPYPDHQSGTTAAEMQARGQAILRQEDAWVGELLAVLEKNGQLDNTIIVVLGDHGLRSISENPDLRRGTIDETAFHVPLIIRAPKALDHTEKINWLTSHIDVAPTLLDLLGLKGERDSEQGTAIWNPALAQRATFFFAKPMFGADGYTKNGDFFMWHYFSDTVYQKNSAEFDPSDIVPRRSSTAQTVTRDITMMVALEKAWHRKFSVAAASSDQPPVQPAAADRK
jgi:hypothetical protein